MNGFLRRGGRTVLINAADPYQQEVLELLLRTEGYRPIATAHLLEGLRVLRELESASAVLTDSPSRLGLDLGLMPEIQRVASGIPVILLTADRFDLEEVREAGFAGAIRKPYEHRELLGLLRRAVRESLRQRW